MGDGRENLRPFKKGQSGNPKGRKPGLSTQTLLRKLLAMPARDMAGNKILDEEGLPLTYEAALHIGQLKKAAEKSDTLAYNAVLDRMEGKPKQTVTNVEMSHEDWINEMNKKGKGNDES